MVGLVTGMLLFAGHLVSITLLRNIYQGYIGAFFCTSMILVAAVLNFQGGVGEAFIMFLSAMLGVALLFFHYENNQLPTNKNIVLIHTPLLIGVLASPALLARAYTQVKQEHLHKKG